MGRAMVDVLLGVATYCVHALFDKTCVTQVDKMREKHVE